MCSTFALRKRTKESPSVCAARQYTVTFDVKDGGGNSSQWQCRIQVPRNGPAIDSGPRQCVGSCP